MVENIFILAGGAGTRLWPASNRSFPKQFLKVRNGKSLLALTITRALALGLKGNVYIITLKEQMDAVISECLTIPEGREKIVVLPEPEPKNTAPALAAAAGYLRAAGKGNERVIVMPADHIVTPVEKFRRDAEKAGDLAREGFFVTFGIKPVYPATGYGYIEAGEREGPGYKVKRFREKPDERTAEKFIKQGNFYWNSGMFAFSVDTFWKECTAHAPDIERVFRALDVSGEHTVRGIGVILDTDAVAALYASAPKTSIDYAVMEKSTNAVVIPADFTWNDIGSWDEMAEIIPAAEEQTALGGPDLFQVNAKGNFVLSDIPVALCGVEDLIVVQKNGVLLICKKGKGQLVKDVVTKVKEKEVDTLL